MQVNEPLGDPTQLAVPLPKPGVIENDYGRLRDAVQQGREDKTIVCTIGSFDILHWGHIDYLREARGYGDVLVVGVDSDMAYERYKKRLVLYPERDRQEMVAALRYADFVTLIDDVDNSGEWQMALVRTLGPDIFVCNDRSYSPQQRAQLNQLCPGVKSITFRTPATMYSSSAVAEHLKSLVQKLDWERLSAEDFEQLVFLLVSTSRNYENVQWLQHTNSPDRGRDISAFRADDDDLCGFRQLRVIIQCKHWLSKSVGVRDVNEARAQMELWGPPRVDVLVIATSGRFSGDAVTFIERHNSEAVRLHIVMWPESHLQLLLARRPDIVDAFLLASTS